MQGGLRGASGRPRQAGAARRDGRPPRRTADHRRPPARRGQVSLPAGASGRALPREDNKILFPRRRMQAVCGKLKVQ